MMVVHRYPSSCVAVFQSYKPTHLSFPANHHNHGTHWNAEPRQMAAFEPSAPGCQVNQRGFRQCLILQIFLYSGRYTYIHMYAMFCIFFLYITPVQYIYIYVWSVWSLCCRYPRSEITYRSSYLPKLPRSRGRVICAGVFYLNRQ